MFFGNDVVEVWRHRGKNRDGDGVWELSHRIVGCNYQPSGLQRWPEADKSDGGQSQMAVKASSILFTQPRADIKLGDRVKVGGLMHRVTGNPVIHTYPSGHQPGMKVHLTEVEKW